MSFVVNALTGHEIRIFLSPEATPGHSEVAALDGLELFECRLCDQLENEVRSRPAGSLGLCDLATLADKTGAEVGLLPQPNSPAGLQTLRDEKPDLIVSVRYRKIFKEEAIQVPTFGIINLHSGILPHYRGAMATFWAMLNGDQTIGATLHYIDDRTIDTGPVIGIARRSLDYTHTYLANVMDLYPAGARMIADAVAEIERDGRAACTQQTETGHYYSFPKAADFARFRASGYRLYERGELASFIDRHSAN
jgi:methionyl-tRNA formyltransferase